MRSLMALRCIEDLRMGDWKTRLQQHRTCIQKGMTRQPTLTRHGGKMMWGTCLNRNGLSHGACFQIRKHDRIKNHRIPNCGCCRSNQEAVCRTRKWFTRRIGLAVQQADQMRNRRGEGARNFSYSPASRASRADRSKSHHPWRQVCCGADRASCAWWWSFAVWGWWGGVGSVIERIQKKPWRLIFSRLFLTGVGYVE